jgi:hypothetical protein
VAIPVTSKAVADDADSKTAQSSTGAVASAPRQAYMTAFDTEEKPLVTVRLPVSDPDRGPSTSRPPTGTTRRPCRTRSVSHPEGVAGIPEVEFVSRMTRTSSAASPAGYGTSMVPAADAFSASVPDTNEVDLRGRGAEGDVEAGAAVGGDVEGHREPPRLLRLPL